MGKHNNGNTGKVERLHKDCSVGEKEGRLSLGGDIRIKFQKMDVSNQVNKEWVEDILSQRKRKHKNAEMGQN